MTELVEPVQAEYAPDSDDEDIIEGEDFLSRMQRILAKKGYLCQPEFQTTVCKEKLFFFHFLFCTLQSCNSVFMFDFGTLRKSLRVKYFFETISLLSTGKTKRMFCRNWEDLQILSTFLQT